MKTFQNPDFNHWWRNPKILAAVQQRGNFGFCEWDNTNHCTKSCTPEYAAIFGMDLKEVIHSQSSWDKVLSQIVPDDRDAYIAHYGNQDAGETDYVDYRIIRKDGQIRHVRLTGVSLFDTVSEYNPAIGMVQDITDDMVRAQKLSDSVTLNNQIEIIGEFGQFIWFLDTDTYKYVSPGFARIHGKTMQQFLADIERRGEDFSDIHPDDREQIVTAFERQTVEKIDLNLEYRLVQPDGKLRWVHEQSTVEWDAVNSTNLNVGIIQDISAQKNLEHQLIDAKNTLETQVAERTRELSETFTELQKKIKETKKASAQLEDRNAELERFVYTVSHELQAPLVTIKGFVGLLGKDLENNDILQAEQDLNRIDNAAGTMATQLNDLLEWSRKGNSIGELSTINLNQLTQHALELHRGQIEEKKINVTVNQMPEAQGNASRIKELLSNLIENSIKFLGDQNPPCLEIGAVETDGEIQCYVRDNAIGIKPKYHHKVFGLFERLESDTEGTGIGLAIVKRNIESHGGKVWIDSKGDNTGCTIYFSLPAATAIDQPGELNADSLPGSDG